MFNPYLSGPELETPRPVPAASKPANGTGGLFGKLERVEREDLILAFLVFLLAGEEEDDLLWPLIAALLYLIL